MLDQTAAEQGPGGRPGAGAPHAWRAAPARHTASPGSCPEGMGLIRTVGSGPVGGLRPFLKIIRRVAPSEPQLWPLHRFFLPREPRAGRRGRRSSFPTPPAPPGPSPRPLHCGRAGPRRGAPERVS